MTQISQIIKEYLTQRRKEAKKRWLLAVILLPFLSGCNNNDAKNLTDDTRKLAETSGVALANATLAGKVNGVLSIWKGVDMSGFKVQAEGGTVTLDGTVRNSEEKQRILNVVQSIRGVDKIVNKLKVGK